MKSLLKYYMLLFCSFYAYAQEISVPEKLKTIPNTECYWAYSVERTNTKNDSIHNYTIRVNIAQIDSTGNYKGNLKLNNVIVYCQFVENGNTKKKRFKQSGENWISKFKIHTNKSLPLEIIANYDNQESIMPLKLNQGTYPGE